MKIFSLTAGLLILFCVLVPFVKQVSATPEYAQQTGYECRVCHINPAGGGELTGTGKRFLEDLKSKGTYQPLSLTQHIVRLLIGYVHLLAAILWFGTIMYVHLLLKPAYASKGLPKGELRLGWLCMIVLLITGTLLTVARIRSLDMFYTTQFGILLSIKIFLFLIMFVSALIVTVFIGPRLRRKLQSPVADLIATNMTAEQLAHFDGKEGRPAYIAYKGIIYNVTQGRFWKNGLHVMKHAAGNDLTALLKSAPHGEDKVLGMPQVGTLVPSGQKTKLPSHLRIFYFFAYMNLVMVFLITLIVALWRWW